MGTYFAWVNHDKREEIDLAVLTRCGSKENALCHPIVAKALAVLFSHRCSILFEDDEYRDGEKFSRLEKWFGHWKGDRVEVMADDWAVTEPFNVSQDEVDGFYQGPRYTNISLELRELLYEGETWSLGPIDEDKEKESLIRDYKELLEDE